MDGIIVVNKPQGVTSHDIVQRVKKITKQKVGHTGTLDPNATGVLPLLIGKGTLLSKYLINHDKTYKVTLKLGEKMDTADIEGNVIEKKDVDLQLLKKDNIIKNLDLFKGKQKQTPPKYSAIKVNGKKLYEYARKGIDVNIKPREIEIYNIVLDKVDINKQEIDFTVDCSKGTYIRSLCEDIAEKLNTVGYMSRLNRIMVGEFDLNSAVAIEELEKKYLDSSFIKKNYISIESFFKNKEKVILNITQLNKFLNGAKLQFDLKDDIYKIYNKKGDFIGTATVRNNLLKRDIII